MTALNWLAFGFAVVAAAAAGGHALLSKREPQSALGWIAVCVMFPAVGPLLYFVFGINRIRTRARRLHAAFPELVTRMQRPTGPPRLGGPDTPPQSGAPELADGPLPAETGPELRGLMRLGDVVTEVPVLAGNRVELLRNGEQTFPAMLEAIDAATESAYLATYIFETNESGQQIAAALGRAAERGVRVRALIDGVGELYDWPRATRVLREAGVIAERFLPPRLLPPQVNINLRNHRKILVADSAIAFAGGMNIGDRHRVTLAKPHRVVDVHFRLEGPVALQLESAFLDDWEFVTGEEIAPGPPSAGSGSTFARTVVDGPNEDLEQLVTILCGAVASARERVWIMTPYFLPPRDLVATMKTAALRGVDVCVVLPAANNLPYVHWASRNVLWELLHWGVKVRYQPPPFSHSKLFLVDDGYALIGSANLDPRSLRLNFELSVELFDPEVVKTIDAYFRERMEGAHAVSSEELDSRPLWVRMRDAAAWLFSPYL